jgi:hypothetical protein
MCRASNAQPKVEKKVDNVNRISRPVPHLLWSTQWFSLNRTNAECGYAARITPDIATPSPRRRSAQKHVLRNLHELVSRVDPWCFPCEH